MGSGAKLLRIIPYVLVVGVIYAAAFLTFEHLFSATPSGSYFQNVVVVLLGTVLTVVVTAILLSEQSHGQEAKERHIAVFGKMVARYERMIRLLARAEEQGEPDQRQSCELHEALYDMALFCSPATLDTTTRFLRERERDREGAGDTEGTGERVSLFDVVARFREDIGLPLSPANAAQLAALEQTILDRRRRQSC